MAATMRSVAPCRVHAFGAAAPCVARPARTSVISASYKNKENIDLSKVPAYAKSEQDTGSPEFQVATLSARVQQISKHLATNKKDHAAKRGLIAILSLRKSLLKYLYREDRDSYDRMIKDFNIRGVIVRDVRGASRVATSNP